MAGLLRKLSFVSLLLAIALYSGFHSAEAREEFEKGDAIYSDLGENLPVWFLGHAGLYWEWPDTGDPDNYRDHKIIESTSPTVHESTFEDFYNLGDFWSVRTTNLTATRRRIIVNTAWNQIGKPYAFFWGYKGLSGFRCDGLVEYCYEMAGIDIVPGDTWSPHIANLLPGRVLLTPWRQMQRLDLRAFAKLWKVSLGKYDEFGEIYGPIYIGAEAVEPDADGKYYVSGTCTIKAYASDTYRGSGLTLMELWLGYPDDTPEPTGPDDTTSTRLKRWDDNYDIEHDYAYDWHTTTIEDGEYTLYAKAFDQAGNTKVSDGVIVVVGRAEYLNVKVVPAYIDITSSPQTFAITVELWNFGACDGPPIPEGSVPKQAGTESWIWDAQLTPPRYRLETISTNQIEPFPSLDTYADDVIVTLSPLYSSGTAGIYKSGWDGTVTLTEGVGSVSGVKYRDKDGNDWSDEHMVLLITGNTENATGNDLLMINPYYLNGSWSQWVSAKTADHPSVLSCSQAYINSVNDYLAKSPSGYRITHFLSYCWTRMEAYDSPLRFKATMSNSVRNGTFDLSEDNIFNTFGITLSQIKQAGFYVSVYVLPEPGNTIKEFVTGASLLCPAQSGKYMFGDVMNYLGNPSATFALGGQDWDIPPAKPTCPTAAGQTNYRGYEVRECKIYFITQ